MMRFLVMAVLLTGSLAGNDMAVPYRADQKNDGYIAEKWLLDYAVPEGEKDMVTGDWVHGGGGGAHLRAPSERGAGYGLRQADHEQAALRHNLLLDPDQPWAALHASLLGQEAQPQQASTPGW